VNQDQRRQVHGGFLLSYFCEIAPESSFKKKTLWSNKKVTADIFLKGEKKKMSNLPCISFHSNLTMGS